MSLTLDLDKAHLTRHIGDLIIAFTWMNDERAMVILPAFRKYARWYIVLDSAAFKYDDPNYLAMQGKVAAEVLGMRPAPENWFKIAKVIHEGLPDLIRMPFAPQPEKMLGSMGTVALRENGVVVDEFELVLDKPGAVYV